MTKERRDNERPQWDVTKPSTLRTFAAERLAIFGADDAAECVLECADYIGEHNEEIRRLKARHSDSVDAVQKHYAAREKELTADVATLRAALVDARATHGEQCRIFQDGLLGCDCGAQEHNARIAEALSKTAPKEGA